LAAGSPLRLCPARHQAPANGQYDCYSQPPCSHERSSPVQSVNGGPIQ
jgi:hypothetical protein